MAWRGRRARWRPTLLMLVILPFWTSFLIRVYAWIGILKPEGLLNQLLLWLGVIDCSPLQILNTDWAVYIGIVYSYLPFMVLPLYAALEKMDDTLLEAAADLGCTPIKAFWQVTFPLSLPGVVAGCYARFIPAVGEFVIPDLLGGSATLMIGKTLWDEFFINRDWPAASAVAIVLLLVLVVPIVYLPAHPGASSWRRADEKRPHLVQRRLDRCSASPSSICRSSSSSSTPSTHRKLVTVWGGWSTRVVRRALPQRAASGRGLGHAARRRCSRRRSPPCSARWRRSRSSRSGASPAASLFSGMIYAPLVMPEVITGLSLLLLFVAHRLRRAASGRSRSPT